MPSDGVLTRRRIGRTAVMAGATLAVLAGGLAGCAKAVSGQAIAGATVPATSTPAGGPGSGSPTVRPPSSGTNGDLSQQAQQVCSQLPKNAPTSAFGLPDATITAASGTTRPGGILEVKCVVNSSNGFRANVVVQIYPTSTLGSADQYFQLMQRQFSSVQPLTGIAGADVAGIFQDHQTGTTVDEAFAARKDATSNTVDVVICGVADTAGIQPKLVAFLSSLANS